MCRNATQFYNTKVAELVYLFRMKSQQASFTTWSCKKLEPTSNSWTLVVSIWMRPL